MSETAFEILTRPHFDSPKLPTYGVALMRALHFSRPDFSGLRELTPSEWKSLLGLCDSAQLTLLLGWLAGSSLPEHIKTRIRKNWHDSALRLEKLKTYLLEIADNFTRQSIDYCLLKGLTHSPEFTPHPLLRSQGDIDLWCSPEQITAAYDVLVTLGYKPVGKSKGRHLDPMVRETSWAWRGDYFATDLPIPVDLHFELWDNKMEFIPGPNEIDLWRRRTSIRLAGATIPALDTADTLTFAVLHFMMHLFHGDLRLQRAWEIAYFLEKKSYDSDFWRGWKTNSPPDVLRLQVVTFALVQKWFGCALPDLILEEVQNLPDEVTLWLEIYYQSPVEGLFIPNKDELWLNLCLVNSFSQKCRLVFRRLLPLHAIAIPSKQASNRVEGDETASRTQSRMLRHLITLPSTCYRGVEWWWRKHRLTSDFLRFLIASALFDFGEFIFFLLYNLYVLELGFDERFMGQLTAAMTTGTFVGVIPAAAFTRRFGLQTAVLVAILGTAAATTFRALVAWPPGMLAGAFLSGLFMSFWAVSLPPAIANLTSSRNRTFGFSLTTAIGIGSGVFAGFIGSRIPGALLHLRLAPSSLAAKQFALVLGSGLAALALLPALLLRFPRVVVQPQSSGRQYPRSALVVCFMTALFLWTIGTGGCNPFFSVYLAKQLHLNLGTIGVIFSGAQMTQVLAIPFAPLVLKRLGQVRGIAAMQLATAVTLLMLAFASSATAAALLYVTYMSFQYMSEPCLLSLLMTRVSRTEQSGASALNFLTTSFAGILAASIAGAMLIRVGYQQTLCACAVVIALAAVTFYVFLKDRAMPESTRS